MLLMREHMAASANPLHEVHMLLTTPSLPWLLLACTCARVRARQNIVLASTRGLR